MKNAEISDEKLVELIRCLAYHINDHLRFGDLVLDNPDSSDKIALTVAYFDYLGGEDNRDSSFAPQFLAYAWAIEKGMLNHINCPDVCKSLKNGEMHPELEKWMLTEPYQHVPEILDIQDKERKITTYKWILVLLLASLFSIAIGLSL